MLIECGGSRVLLDCGFGNRELVQRLGRLGARPEDLSGILITHEHGDHCAGAYRCALEYGVRLYATRGTYSALGLPADAGERFAFIDSDADFAIGDLRILAVAVPHDAREPVQFVLDDGAFRLGVLTDLGCVTPHVRQAFDGCDAMVLECNHDPGMLEASSYPASVKQRIRGQWGHLDNASSAALLASVDTRRLRHVVAAHLSERNNHPSLARAALAGALGCNAESIEIADQETGFGWRELR